jgi:alpha-ketoglutarate-dependent taurine dioxygenase
MQEVSMEIRCLGDGIGAEITDVDVKRLDEAGFARIYRAWLDYNVISIRDQALTTDEYLAYSRRFGALAAHPSAPTRHPDHPEITMLGANKFGPDGKLNNKIYRRGAEAFHTDGNYEQEPFKATQLYALAVPSRGGDTYFASMYTAYDALPERLKQRLEGCCGVYIYGGRKKEYNPLLTKEDFAARKPVRHPILGRHRETGRRVLYFDTVKISHIEGMEQAESDALIEELAAHMTPRGTQYTHKWRKGDIVIWDNRCSYHKAAGDYPPEEDRIHWRVSIKEAPSGA